MTEAGCPAHVGIDPDGQAVPMTNDRLPRTCGDRPDLLWPAIVIVLSAPHTWG